MSTAATQAPPAVTYDPYRSTPSREVYYVPSDSVPYPRDVRYYVNDRRWSCSCPARVECHHIREARAYKTRHWWALFWGTCTDTILMDAQLSYAQQQAEGTLTDEGTIALEELSRFLAGHEAVTA